MARTQRGPPTPILVLSHPSQPSWRSFLPWTRGAYPLLHPPDIGPHARNECCVPCTLLPEALSHPPLYPPPGPRRGEGERPRFRYRSRVPARPPPTVPQDHLDVGGFYWRADAGEEAVDWGSKWQLRSLQPFRLNRLLPSLREGPLSEAALVPRLFREWRAALGFFSAAAFLAAGKPGSRVPRGPPPRFPRTI